MKKPSITSRIRNCTMQFIKDERTPCPLGHRRRHLISYADLHQRCELILRKPLTRDPDEFKGYGKPQNL